MSLKYGLNVKKAAAPASGPPIRKPIFDEPEADEDEEQNATSGDAAVVEDISTFGRSNKQSSTSHGALPPSRKPPLSTRPNAAPPPPRRLPKQEQDASSVHAARTQVHAAEAIDASIFDYDSFHDAKQSVTESKRQAARQDALERKPKYIANLLDAAERRKQDALVAREKLLQREREQEGEEFADKEKFVTDAYKKQREETRKLEAEEEKRKEKEEERRRRAGGGMQGFYRGLMDEREKQHRSEMEAAERMEREGGVGTSGGEEHAGQKSEADIAAELQAQGRKVHLNEEGQVTDKRELLSAGLNVAPTGGKEGRGAEHLRASSQRASGANSAFARRDAEQLNGRLAQRERQSRMMEEQLAAQAKRAREEEEEERLRLEKAAKSQKSAGEISDAKARYLARKAARERGES